MVITPSGFLHLNQTPMSVLPPFGRFSISQCTLDKGAQMRNRRERLCILDTGINCDFRSFVWRKDAKEIISVVTSFMLLSSLKTHPTHHPERTVRTRCHACSALYTLRLTHHHASTHRSMILIFRSWVCYLSR